MMRIVPYVAVNGIPFSISELDLRSQLGPPISAGRNSVGLNELDYRDAVYRFQDGGRLEEVTLRGDLVYLELVAIAFDELAAFVAETDPGRFERAGFVVSPRHGNAIVPEQRPWVTALARHCIATWRALK